jgi:hypothetical protein
MSQPSIQNASPQVVQTLALENGACLEVIDASRPLAGDRWQVNAVFRVTVPVIEAVLAGGSAHLELGEVRRRVGDRVVFEKCLERTFIAAQEKDLLFDRTVARYLEGALDYLSRPTFARNLVMRRYQQALKPFFHPRQEETDAHR